jgi:hypothetical protein
VHGRRRFDWVRQRFISQMLRPYLRRLPQVGTALPLLYRTKVVIA